MMLIICRCLGLCCFRDQVLPTSSETESGLIMARVLFARLKQNPSPVLLKRNRINVINFLLHDTALNVLLFNYSIMLFNIYSMWQAGLHFSSLS